MNVNRDLTWLLGALVFGLLVLPALVYATGVLVFGPYAHGGLPAFLGDFFTNLANLRWFSWSLAVGPLVLVAIWRFAARRPRA